MRILVTGHTGTLGQTLVPILKKKKHTVIGYSRDEQKQRIYPHNITQYLGDVRDRDRIIEASRGIDMVFHLAALKCVDSLEENPEEAFRTNIDGTANVLHAQRVNAIQRIVLVSTDKACKPITAYGVSKAAAERLVLRNPRNTVVRYGNVLASRGSVINTWVNQIRAGKPVTIVHPEMTRYFWTKEDAVDFVMRRAFATNGGLYTPNMKAVHITELAEIVCELLGAPFVWKNLNRGIEKIHEDMTDTESSETAPRWDLKELERVVKGLL